MCIYFNISSLIDFDAIVFIHICIHKHCHNLFLCISPIRNYFSKYKFSVSINTLYIQ